MPFSPKSEVLRRSRPRRGRLLSTRSFKDKHFSADIHIGGPESNPPVCSRREPSTIAQSKSAAVRRGWVEDKGRVIRPGRADRMLTPWNPASGQGFALPLRGGNLSVERLPRVSPWAIFLSYQREELPNRLYCVQRWKCRAPPWRAGFRLSAAADARWMGHGAFVELVARSFLAVTRRGELGCSG